MRQTEAHVPISKTPKEIVYNKYRKLVYFWTSDNILNRQFFQHETRMCRVLRMIPTNIYNNKSSVLT